MKLFGFALLVSVLELSAAQQNFPPSFNPVIASVNILELSVEQPGELVLIEIASRLTKNICSLLVDFVIYDVNATDPEGDNITYSIPDNSVNSNLFRVDTYSGRVFTQDDVVLDREV